MPQPQPLLTWTTSPSDRVEYDYSQDFNTDFYDYTSSVTDNILNYDYYTGHGITGANVLNEMRPNPTRPSFITGSNVIR